MSSPSIPTPPDPSTAAIGGMTADLANYPFQTIINSLAQTGGNANIGGQNYDFTGLGNADQATQMSAQMAQTLLDIQNNYGSDFIAQKLADLKQADPAGYAARKDLFDQIQQSATANPDRPLANDLQSQINGMLDNSGQLDEEGLNEVQQGVRGQQVARGITLGNAPAAQEAGAVVQASDALNNSQQGSALDYLQSGTSPQDVAYRRIQQSLSNLGAFSNGQTPEARFGSLSGAGNGAAPYNPVNYQGTAPPSSSSAITGLNFANGLYGQQTNQALNQANPWLAGLSLGQNALTTAGNIFGNSNNYNPSGLSGLIESPTQMSTAIGGNPTGAFEMGSDFVG